MKLIIGSTNITDLVAHGYTYERTPQYGGTVTTLDGTDHTAKLRDVVKITAPIIPLTTVQLNALLALFPTRNAYVSVTYDDPVSGTDRTVNMKYETRTQSIKTKYSSGVTYWDGLKLVLTER